MTDREAFESDMRKRGWPAHTLTRDSEKPSLSPGRRDSPHVSVIQPRYLNEQVEQRWQGWQAAFAQRTEPQQQLTNAEIDWRQQYHGIVDGPVQQQVEPKCNP